MTLTLDVPDTITSFSLPDGVQERLNSLLDAQDDGDTLTLQEQKEAEGLVELVEMLSLIKLRSGSKRSPSL